MKESPQDVNRRRKSVDEIEPRFAGLFCGQRGKSAIPGRPMVEEYSRAHPPNVGSQLQGS